MKKLEQMQEENRKMLEKIKENNQVLEKYVLINSKFADKLSKSSSSLCNILKSAYEIENIQEAKEIIKKHESQNKVKIIKSEKFKLIKHLGNLYDCIEDLFNIDSLTFDSFQHQIANNKELPLEDKHISENDIESIISVDIYFRKEDNQFSENEISNRIIDIQNLKAVRLSMLEYDKLFNITKKFSLIELKEKAYKIFEVGLYDDRLSAAAIKSFEKFKHINNYIFMDINMRWWPFILILYDEIEKKNIDKGFVKPNSKFFQINPLLNVK